MTKSQEIAQRAEALAKENTLGVVLDNLFFLTFRVIGLALGRTWFYGSKLVYVIWLAFLDGYVQGVKAVREAQAAPGQAPQGPVQGPLLDDERIMMQHNTPFGVPFGPNIQAFSEPG
jgi:hypothetical protein